VFMALATSLMSGPAIRALAGGHMTRSS
jgi:hypothetical protein